MKRSLNGLGRLGVSVATLTLLAACAVDQEGSRVSTVTADELPPARAFWSLTLYDRDQGFFIPNDRRKYSVGQNGGMQLDEDGGIAIYVAAEQPDGVPPENWLPIERKDLALSLQLRIYVPDLEAYESWTRPVAERIPGT